MGEILKPDAGGVRVRERRPEREPEISAERFLSPDLTGQIPDGVTVRYEVNGIQILDGKWIVTVDGVSMIMSEEEFQARFEFA